MTCKCISDVGAVALAQALCHNSPLTLLNLSNNSISDAGAVALAQALHDNTTLNQLDLSYNCIGDAGAKALARALHHSSKLRRLGLGLDLSANDGIGEEGTHQLVQALTVNSSTCHLSLPMECEEYATQNSLYHIVESSIEFYSKIM